MAKDDYEVGYGKPPKHTRFKKGQSGNPKGRPKKSRNFKTDLLATLSEPVRVKEAGGYRNVSTQEAALMRLREKALKGDPRALDRLFALAQTHNSEELAIATSASLDASDEEILAGYVTQQQQRAERCAESEPESGTPVADAADDQDEEDDAAWLR